MMRTLLDDEVRRRKEESKGKKRPSRDDHLKKLKKINDECSLFSYSFIHPKTLARAIERFEIQ